MPNDFILKTDAWMQPVFVTFLNLRLKQSLNYSFHKEPMKNLLSNWYLLSIISRGQHYVRHLQSICNADIISNYYNY